MMSEEWDVLEGLRDAEVLDGEFVDEAALAQELRSMGLDPGEVARRGRETAAVARTSDVSWREVATARQARWKALTEARRAPTRSRRAAMSRAELLEALEEARQRPGVGRRVAAYFRGRNPGLADEDELRGMLEDIELLFTLEEE